MTEPSKPVRREQDSFGPLDVPADALWSAQTERARRNFAIGGRPMPRAFLHGLGLTKAAAAAALGELGHLPSATASAIRTAADAVARGDHDAEFPVDVYQTGSGTSSNMNANEVIATLATRALGQPVHPNDHVNLGQSSNDVIPTAIHVGAAWLLDREVLPALDELAATIATQRAAVGHHVKTGRTHLMDALPLTLDQEFGAWQAQVSMAAERLRGLQPRLHELALGGTAVGTGVNAPEGFAVAACRHLQAATGIAFAPARNPFAALAAQDTAVELSAQLRGVAVVLTKIANDLRWMNSGPLAGFAEIVLPALQPGSSIMPGKVNPVVPEAVAMAAARILGNDLTVALAGQSGNFQLNVMLPVLAEALLDSLGLAARSAQSLARQAIADMKVNAERLAAPLERNPILVTALNARIGYEQGAAIAKRAYQEGRPIIEVATEMTGLPRAELEHLLDPRALTRADGRSAGGG